MKEREKSKGKNEVNGQREKRGAPAPHGGYSLKFYLDCTHANVFYQWSTEILLLKRLLKLIHLGPNDGLHKNHLK